MNDPKNEDVMRALAWYEVVGKNIGSVTVPYNEIQALSALLREKDAHIKMLDEDRLGWADEAVKAQMQVNEKDAEIERLNAEIGRLGEQCRVLTIEYPKITRAEAITEFVERVKEKKINLGTIPVVCVESVNQIEKEMKGETDGKSDL